MPAEKMRKMRRKYANTPRLGLGMQDLGVMSLWIQDRLRAGCGVEGVGGGKQNFPGVPPVEGRGVRGEWKWSRQGRGSGWGVGCGKSMKSPQQSTEKLFVKTFIRIKNL